VERGDRSRHAERGGGLVARRPARGGGEQPVEPAPEGLVEGGDAGDVPLDGGGLGGGLHIPQSKTNAA
jgi:hypothetical protein